MDEGAKRMLCEVYSVREKESTTRVYFLKEGTTLTKGHYDTGYGIRDET